jgi:hypothetical protein
VFGDALFLFLTGRGWGQGGEMNQALYAHMNNKRKKCVFYIFCF